MVCLRYQTRVLGEKIYRELQETAPCMNFDYMVKKHLIIFFFFAVGGQKKWHLAIDDFSFGDHAEYFLNKLKNHASFKAINYKL